jgi:hypothetical protein
MSHLLVTSEILETAKGPSKILIIGKPGKEAGTPSACCRCNKLVYDCDFFQAPIIWKSLLRELTRLVR